MIEKRTTTIREHQMVLLQMLHEIDYICQKNDIRYSLFAGTALGAVRHGGFIPWDDDLDVIMLRSEYERFLALAQKKLDGNIYYLQREFSNHWPMFFTKLRKNNTACIEKYIPKDSLTHQGIYVDIFPCDNLYHDRLLRKVQFMASKLVIANALYMRGYLTESFAKKMLMQISRIMPVRELHHLVEACDANASGMVHSFFGASSRYEKSVYPREWFTETILLPFEDGTFPVSAHYDELLTTLYGDYMRIPTVEERQGKVHAILVDTEKSYEEYAHYRDGMEFDVLTRSIR